jgi:hypothetical protein
MHIRRRAFIGQKFLFGNVTERKGVAGNWFGVALI